VEPRAEAEGNASQLQAARQRKKEKFTALLHHLSIDLLDEAFFELKDDAASGVDGLTWAG
jgi:RNA-directed DNA polymerase